jgi:hypothetical protein
MAGFWSNLRRDLTFQLAADRSSYTDQSSTQQGERTRLGNYDVGVATRDTCAAIEETLAGVDRQLHGHTDGREARIRRAIQSSRQGVIVGPVLQRDQVPHHRAGKGSSEERAVGDAIRAIPADSERATARECSVAL